MLHRLEILCRCGCGLVNLLLFVQCFIVSPGDARFNKKRVDEILVEVLAEEEVET
jgi:hypothetical protein